MAIPRTAFDLESMDPSDIARRAVTFRNDGSNLALLDEGESVVAFELELSAEAVEAGLAFKTGGLYPAPFVAENVIRFYLAVDLAEQGADAFANHGTVYAIEATVTTDSDPPQFLQRTLAIKVVQS